MRSQDVLQLCEANGIARIVINNNSSNMFVLEKDRSATKEYTIQAKQKVLPGIPQTSLDPIMLKKLIARVNNLDNVAKVYQYGHKRQ